MNSHVDLCCASLACMNPLDGRVLITGAAGGIGQALSRALAGRARPLVLSARRSDQLRPLADDLAAEVIECDLEDRNALLSLVEQAGDIDLAVLNAALPASGPLLEYDIDQIDRALEVNLRAQLVTARLLLEGMVKRRHGHIVFISSLAGKAASPGSTLYSATKFGLRGAALSMRQDLARSGVGISVICPGFVSDAGMFAESGVRLSKAIGTVTPEQVAAATVTAVDRNKAEIDVAPLGLRAGAMLAQVAPELAARGQRASGGFKVADQMADSQRSKR